MKILVTGGTGYLGRNVVGALAARGHDLVVFSRKAGGSGLPGRAVDGDVRDAGALERAAAGCDAVCHMAAHVSIWGPSRAFDEVNVGGFANAIAAVRAHRIPRLLCTSSFLALPPAGRTEPLEANEYQRTKVAADRLAGRAVEEGVPLVRVYPGVVYGPGPMTEGNLVGRLIADHLHGRLPGLIGPERRWSFSYADDVAEGHCAALERGQPGARYALGGDNAPQQDVFAIVHRLTGRKPPRRIPFPFATALGIIEEWRARIFGGRPLVTRGAVEIFRHDWSLDSSAAVHDLGYRMTPLAVGIERTVRFLLGGAMPDRSATS